MALYHKSHDIVINKLKEEIMNTGDIVRLKGTEQILVVGPQDSYRDKNSVCYYLNSVSGSIEEISLNRECLTTYSTC
jgi:hypothetical protein